MNRERRHDPTALPLGLCLGWGVGTLGVSIIFNTINVIVARFVTDWLGLAAGTFATLFAAAKLFDAAIDPAIGMLSDRTRSRWGRRRPWLFGGGILCAAGFVGLFFVPSAGESPYVLLYITGALMLYSLGYATFNVPYMAMPAEMTRGYHERARLVSFRVQAIGLGTIFGIAGAPFFLQLVGSDRAGHRLLAIVYGAIALASMLACARFTAGAAGAEPVPSPLGFGERLRIAASNQPFLLLLAVKTLHLGGLAASQLVIVYFFVHVLKRGYGYLGAYGLVISVMLLLSTPLWLRLSRRIGKRNAYIIASVASALVGLTWYWSGPDEPVVWLFARAVLGGVISSGMLLMGQAMLPDAIHHDYVRSGGLRREGLFAGFYTTAEKLASAVGLAATGAWLQTQGYVPSLTGGAVQPASAIAAIYDVMAAIHSALIFASALFLIPYKLDAAIRDKSPAQEALRS
jgi:GPH family glycoside/pentoside/hexuronide:cation symporter